MKDKKTETPEEKDTNEANAQATAEVKEEAQPLTDAEKLKEATDKYTRLYAEYDNFRRRTAKEKIDLIKFGGEETILSFLAVADDLERALAHHKEGEAKEGL
ncbi:MAG TPA: nucleotide exchange factor GrpE, partial [Bacteroidia bacterium]|nr:nucleotide exchange factor GrpE [Bacteroidia bacterium]